MKDLYIRPRRSNRGCLVVLLVLAVLIAAVITWRWSRRSRPVAEKPAAAAPVRTEAAPAAAPEPDAGPIWLAEAKRLKAEERLLEARERAFQVLEKSSNALARAAAESLLGELHTTLLFSPRMMPEKVEYVVQSGDSLNRLAKKFNTTVELIRRGNRIPGSLIRVGDRLRIFTGRFTIHISKSRNDLELRMNDRFFKRYRVGTGEFGKTPTGDFSITQKIPQPTWWRPDGKAIPYGDPENVLGTHWLSLNLPGYGIHGTWQPETVGTQASAGCIRLLNEEIEELFVLVPEGTPVHIVD